MAGEEQSDPTEVDRRKATEIYNKQIEILEDKFPYISIEHSVLCRSDINLRFHFVEYLAGEIAKIRAGK